MIEQSATRIVVRESVEVPAADLFAVLADPQRHLEMDGSGMLRAGADNSPITGIGQVFTMEMHYPSLGDYRTENHVVDFVAGRSIAWMTAREGQPPAGVRWSWELQPEAGNSTTTLPDFVRSAPIWGEGVPDRRTTTLPDSVRRAPIWCESVPDGRTTVIHTYDWSQVTDSAVLARVSFPRVSAEALEGSIRRLVVTASAARG